MPNDTIDSLRIDISSTSTDAVKDLDALLLSLKRLDRFGKSLGKSSGLTKIRSQLEKIASVKFDGLASQLDRISSSVGELEQANNALRVVSAQVIKTPKVDMIEVKTATNALVNEYQRASEEVIDTGERFGEIISEGPQWFKSIQDDCKNIITSFEASASSLNTARERLKTVLGEKSELYSTETVFKNGTNLADSLGDKFERLRLQAELLQMQFDNLSNLDPAKQSKDAWDKLEKQLLSVRLQYQALYQQINKNADAIDNLGDNTEKSKGKLAELFNRLKRVAFYRIVRFILSQIGKAAREGIENIAKFSETANAVMSQYKTEATYIKNSVGSAIIPMLQAITPMVIRLGDSLADISNSIGIIFAAINGQDTFIKAKKYIQEYVGAVEKAKKSTMGFDEINILSRADTENDVSQMFEKVDLNGGDIAGAIAKITALVGSIITLLVIFKGAKISEGFTKMAAGLKSSLSSLKNLAPWKKGALSIAAIAVEAVSVYNVFKDLTNGTISFWNALLTLAPVLTIVGVALNAMLGPVGWLYEAGVLMVSAIAGVTSAQIEMKRKADMTEFFRMEGVALDEVTPKMDSYFRSIGLDKQKEMNEKLTECTNDLIDARVAYDGFWQTVKDAESLNVTQIERLGSAFQDLADATNAFNSAAIEKAMASLRTGIELNITSELTAKLEGLVGSLQVAQDLIGVKVSSLNNEYQKILNDISSGKTTIGEAMPTLNELRQKMNDFTLVDNASSQSWATSVQDAIRKGINAGTDETSIKENINDLTKEKNAYLETIRGSYNSSVDVLKQLIEIDKTQFGGALGFKDGDLEVLAQNYEAQLKEINSEYDKVIESIIGSFQQNALDYDKYVVQTRGENGFESFMYDASAFLANIFGIRNFNGDTGAEAIANKQTAIEQKKFIDWLSSQLSGYATGGYPEDDSIIYVNPKEIIGKMSNGKTTVANDFQIVEGIKQGVVEAMNESGGGQGGDWTIQIVDEDGRVKGETIVTAAERKNRRDGKTVISVGG